MYGPIIGPLLSNPGEINFLVGVSARFKLERLELSGVDCKFKRRNVNIH